MYMIVTYALDDPLSYDMKSFIISNRRGTINTSQIRFVYGTILAHTNAIFAWDKIFFF